MDIRCNGIVADVLSAGGACRVAGRRDASRIHARSEAGLCRLLEAEAVYREYIWVYTASIFSSTSILEHRRCEMQTWFRKSREAYMLYIDGSRLGSDRVSRKFAENRLAATRFVRKRGGETWKQVPRGYWPIQPSGKPWLRAIFREGWADPDRIYRL